MKLSTLLARGRAIRAIGFDDAPFVRGRTQDVSVAGVVCAATRFEGMVWGRVRQDGWNATDAVLRMLVGGKFLPQLHLVLLDGIAFGGFNVVDLPRLYAGLGVPCVAVTRRPPDMERVRHAIEQLPNAARRWRRIEAAGPVHHRPPFSFQVIGESPDVIEGALAALTDRGHVPEALRLAHLIGSAVRTGESGNRA